MVCVSSNQRYCIEFSCAVNCHVLATSISKFIHVRCERSDADMEDLNVSGLPSFENILQSLFYAAIHGILSQGV
jgi:hypothetical protein